MKHDQPEPAADEPHVFDQTNGVVDLGQQEAARADDGRTRDRARTASGIAMLSTQKP